MTTQKIKTLRVNDFSPGIFAYGIGQLAASQQVPTVYSPETPLGAASFAARCMCKPSIGLVPFPAYRQRFLTPIISQLVGASWLFLGGAYALGPVQPTSNAQAILLGNDMIYITFQILNSVGHYLNCAARINVADAVPSFSVLYTTDMGTGPVPLMGTAFAQTRIQGLGAPYPATEFPPVLWWADQEQNLIYSSPDIATGNPFGTHSLSFETAIHCIAHEGRVLAVAQSSFNTGYGTDQALVQEDLFFTDPPEANGFAGTPNFFNPETYSGYGAWGSISSGELLLVKCGAGAIIVSGDLAAPSGVTKLPGVVGTGRVHQKAVSTPSGMLYVTECDGVYAWNGSNTSQKLSNQIPDDACQRPELKPGNALIASDQSCGALVTADCLNNLVFFPNNWVLNLDTNSWWLCEDPAVFTFACFTRSNYQSRYLYGIGPGINYAPNALHLSIMAFDWLNRANSYEWVSAPIPVTQRMLVTIMGVEVIASNPNSLPATIVVTPQTAPGYFTVSDNNVQSATVTIPPQTLGFREFLPFGYRDYNVELGFVATGGTNQSAPILHEFTVHYSETSGTAIA